MTTDELAMLSNEPAVPPKLAADEEAWQQEEARLAGFLRRCYNSEANAEARYTYHEAVAVLGPDRYMSWVAKSAGINASLRTSVWLPWQAGLFALLAIPSIIGFLIAAGGAWGALQSVRSATECTGTAAVASMFGGFSAYLLAIWRRESRAYPRRRRTRA